jgi:endo-1,4-beta-xylanase
LEDSGYAQLASGAFDAVTPENELKWEVVEPERGMFDWGPADRVISFAEQHHQRVRGHTLVWHLQNPAWVVNLHPTREQAIVLLRDHIRRVVSHYRGRVAEWDVVNEAVRDSDGELRATPWLRWIGPDYIEIAFRAARKADPDARLVYNDYGAEQEGTKQRGVLRLLRRLVEHRVPVDAVGLQGHVSTRPLPGLANVLRQYADLGLDVVFTEVDVRVEIKNGVPRHGRAALSAQARQYATLGRACVTLSACKGFVVWGVDDANSWVPEAYPGRGAATLFDANLKPKPAYAALQAALR